MSSQGKGRRAPGLRAIGRWWRDAGWLVRLAWTVGVLQFVFVTVSSYRGGGIDLFWVHKGVKAFLNGESPYDIALFVNPPAALLLLAPLGLNGFEAVRIAFLPIDAITIALAGMICLRLAGLKVATVAGGLMLIILAELPAVRLTLALENVNGLVFLCQAVALAAMLGGRWTRAGVALGLSFAIKPIVVPLLALPLLARQWRSAAIALALPLMLSAVALVFNRHVVTGFLEEAVPFLLQGNHPRLKPHNVSIIGSAHNLGVPRLLGEGLRYLVLFGALALAWTRWTRDEGERTSPSSWTADRLRVLETAGFLLLATVLCFSFSWKYYGVYLIPFLVTIVDSRSLLRHWLVYVALFLMCSPVPFDLQGLPGVSEHLEESRSTLAWLLLLAGMSLSLGRLLRARARPGSALH
jgi:arabinofuranan 3-O-arabinosyltransferase